MRFAGVDENITCVYGGDESVLEDEMGHYGMLTLTQLSLLLNCKLQHRQMWVHPSTMKKLVPLYFLHVKFQTRG